ncbi:MAG TPA: DoxX family protein [Polyangiaceae bacterium]|nr:DoxX family protein [Polyangiaceae bacterium]
MTTIATTSDVTETTATRSRAVTITLWTVQILLAVLFVYGGVNKILVLQPEMREGFAKIGFGDWFMYLTGAMELAGGVGLLIPQLAGVAALELAVVMVGAVLAHLLVLPPPSLALIPGALCIVFLLIARARRTEIEALARKITS